MKFNVCSGHTKVKIAYGVFHNQHRTGPASHSAVHDRSISDSSLVH